MTPEKQRIAIATACGWEYLPGVVNNRPWFRQAHDRPPVSDDEIPDYPNDLNAIHEAEKTLQHRDRRNHALWLADKCGDLGCIYATAAQRAEAFLRVLGKWEDGE